MAKRKPSELNLLLAVDKPVGITSHDVVSKVRRSLDERRVGHAGTLDPLASGVMIVGVGQATRLLGRITLDRKRYLARIMFGFETTTDDAEGEPTRTAPMKDDLLSPMFATGVLREFLGEQEQVPPAYSAISVNGVRSYRRARAGEDVELPARTVEVYAADLVAVDEVDGHAVWTASFDVSKGTYIRSLARDIGRAAGSAAHVADLRRTASGPITSGMCLRMEDLSPERARASALDPASVLRAAGSAAHVADLRRTASGPITSGMCLRMEDLSPERARASALDPASVLGLPVRGLSDDEADAVLNGRITSGMCLRMEDLSPERARASALDPASVLGLPVRGLSDDEADAVLNGRAISARPVPSAGASVPELREGCPCALAHGGMLRAVARVEGGLLRLETVFPQGIEGVAR